MSTETPDPMDGFTIEVKRLILSLIEPQRPLTTVGLLLRLLDHCGPSIGGALKQDNWQALRKYLYSELVLAAMGEENLEFVAELLVDAEEHTEEIRNSSQVSISDIIAVILARLKIQFHERNLKEIVDEDVDVQEIEARFYKLFEDAPDSYISSEEKSFLAKSYARLIADADHERNGKGEEERGENDEEEDEQKPNEEHKEEHKEDTSIDKDQKENDAQTELMTDEELERKFDEIFNSIDSGKGDQAKTLEREFTTLRQFGLDLIAEAVKGKFKAVVGRDEEVQLLIETLCRRTKRNPILVGPAGTGKTAIVEKFANLVVEDQVPDLLKDTRIFSLQLSALIAGNLEENITSLLKEARQEGVILFIDEIHTIIGAGGTAGRNDLAGMLKPLLARGDIACMGATTDQEFRTYIQKDPALERRFQPIRVSEPTPEETMGILKVLADELFRLREVRVSDGVLKLLVDSAQQFLRNRRFPDKAVDLLEQCVAYALTRQRQEVDLADALSVVQRIVGMPLDVNDKLAQLKNNLLLNAVLPEEDCGALISSLGVTLRGFDVCPHHPNQVILLTGEAIRVCDRLAHIIASALFGSEERITSLDLSGYTHPSDLAMLIGSPPGYIGYNDYLPIYRVAQTPWSVICFRNLHSCHASIKDFIGGSLNKGYITDSKGDNIYLSESIIILTAELEPGSPKISGFSGSDAEAENDERNLVGRTLGSDYVNAIHMVCDRVPASGGAAWRWLKNTLLNVLADKYKSRGVEVLWDESLQDWCSQNEGVCVAQRDWERIIDGQINTVLVNRLFGGEGDLDSVDDADSNWYKEVVVGFDNLRNTVQVIPGVIFHTVRN